ncbi:MAG TPA: tetratricopeptide repeat protein [Longimicrobiales bacterium]|nr:tetratricopeptide repeat protein [Longimicrobiales bacterium]
MAIPFLSSEEYDERAHALYNDGDYDSALDTLKQGLLLYPDSVELYVGLGYTRMAREEFAWARNAFETSLVLDPHNIDAMVGLGEVMLRLGRQDQALELFGRARDAGCSDDIELLLAMGRALYRERMYQEACEVFQLAADTYPDSAEAVAALAYTAHSLGDVSTARRELRRALRIDPDHYEARVYLAHILYDQNNWSGALHEIERVPIEEQWDPLAVRRYIEMKRALDGVDLDSPELTEWHRRLEFLESEDDEIERILAEIEAAAEPPQLELFRPGEGSSAGNGPHVVRTRDGRVFSGTWLEIVQQFRDAEGRPGETLSQFMRRLALEEKLRSGIGIPADDPEGFVLGHGRAGRLLIER